MALTPELGALKRKLDAIGLAKRTLAQKTLQESTFASVTKMTSPGDGPCSCCGR